MEKFRYYNIECKSLHVHACDWLTKMGLRETLWILDVSWLHLTYDADEVFKQWIREK